MLAGKKIILGVTGSIAAYKAAYLLRLLVKEGAEVQVIMTKAGKEFITPVTMSALSSKPVLGEFFQTGDGTWNSHVDLGLWADLFLIAPASANTIAKMATGVCDNLLLTTYLSVRCPVMIAPAMDLDMFQHSATQSNIDLLVKRGCEIIEPCDGELASGLFGKGRMEEPEKIIEKIDAFFAGQQKKSVLKDKTILITAGPTYEKIDPVRFIGNHSSGKMGYSLAEELASRGAMVTLVSGPVNITACHPAIQTIRVSNAGEMFEACADIFPKVDAALFTAAVADYTVANPATDKIKRTGIEMGLRLVPTKDIAAELGRQKKPGQVVAGFALETANMIENARKKLDAKNLDFIVLNPANRQDAGFNADTNQVTIIDKDNKTTEYPLKSKAEVARDIVDYLESMFMAND